jgi:hypothetical protein
MAWTPAAAIEIYLGVREDEREDKKAFEERSKERKDKMDLLETYLLGAMNERGEEQIKTSAGTAYKSPQLRVTMTNREEVVKYVAETGDFDVFTNHVAKDHIKTLLDERNPRFLELVETEALNIQQFTACNVRRA